MRIGCFIPFHNKLSTYLPLVVSKMSFCDEIYLRQSDFSKECQVAVRNGGIKKLSNCDYVFTVDSDEIILKRDSEKLIKLATDCGYDVIMCPVINYTKDLKHRYKTEKYKVGDHAPIVLVNPKQVEFYETRCAKYSKPLYCKDIFIHHFGFAYSEEIMKWKHSNYWNVGNKNEIKDIMSLDVEPCELPEELKWLTK